MELKEKSSNIKRNAWSVLINSPERYIFFAGLGLILIFVFWIVLGWSWSIPKYQKFVSLFGARFVTGRPGGVYFGHVLGLEYFEILIINMVVDTVAVFILYPIFVLSYNLVFQIRILKNKINRTFRVAEKTHSMIKKYGKVGLFLFVLFPLWGTGPVVGCAIGIVMGLKRWANMAIVLGATYLAIICWIFILTDFYEWTLSFGPSVPVIIITILLIICMAFYILERIRRKD
ncbi:MAG: small multi-drug export protein [Candidatus Omnitrophica bacterium]|nr:small multi-drug export protein [Candidatus Omnitrophota bacterium]